MLNFVIAVTNVDKVCSMWTLAMLLFWDDHNMSIIRALTCDESMFQPYSAVSEFSDRWQQLHKKRDSDVWVLRGLSRFTKAYPQVITASTLASVTQLQKGPCKTIYITHVSVATGTYAPTYSVERVFIWQYDNSFHEKYVHALSQLSRYTCK